MFRDQTEAFPEPVAAAHRDRLCTDSREGAFPAPSLPTRGSDSLHHLLGDRIPDLEEDSSLESLDAIAEAEEIDGANGERSPWPFFGYPRELVDSVWRFAESVPGVDPELWRRDEFGSWIHRLDYGRRSSRFGWEIFDPGLGRRSQGVFAMRPMQWESHIAQFETLDPDPAEE